MSKNVVLTLESRFMDEYGEYANLPVFNAHGSIVGYVGGEVLESGNPCEFNRLNDEGFTFCASATEVVRLKAENAKLRELLAKARDPRRIGGTADPESFVYAIEQLREFRWQHATNDEEAIPYINNVADAHERENAKLRELVRDLWLQLLNAYDRKEVDEFADRMRELGVEV